MFKYNLQFNNKNDKAIYGPANIFRGISLFFSLFILYFFILSILESNFTISALVPLSISILLLLSSLFRDEFIFDKSKRILEIKFGFGPWYKKEVIPFNEIERLELTHFVKGKYGKDSKSGKLNKAQIVLSVKLKCEDERKMEVYSERSSSGKLEEIAHKLSIFSSLPLYADRDREEEEIDIKSLR